MKHTGISSAEARRRVRIAQFAGLGVGVMAVALWAMDLPGLSPTLPQKPTVVDPGTGATTPAIIQVARIDADTSKGISERLDVAANRPPAAAVPAPTGEPPPAPMASETPFEYLGAIQEPERMLALVSIKGRQKIVSEGTELKVMTPAAEGRPESVEYAATVIEIKRDYITIEEDGGAKRKIDLKGKSAKVAWVKNMPTPVQGTQAGAALAAAFSQETRQRLLAQGIDPAQAERARQAQVLASRGRAVPGSEPGSTVVTAANQKMIADTDAILAKKNGARQRAVPTDADVAPTSDAQPRGNQRAVD